MNWRLVADVGGTNVRFARATGVSKLADLAEFPVSSFACFEDALTTYLLQVDAGANCLSAAIAGAGPVSGGRIILTNNDWCISQSSVSALLAGKPVRLFNDLQAAALSIPMLKSADLLTVVKAIDTPDPLENRLAINVGTGFGASPLLHTVDGWWAAGTEAGHMSLAATSAKELELLASPAQLFHSTEDALSGRGLQNLHTCFADADSGVPPSAQTILASAKSSTPAARAVEMFTTLFARACGDLVLAHGAWGGVYLFGSVALEWSRQETLPSFATTFTDKGLMSQRMAKVPVHAVLRDNAPLFGLAGTGIWANNRL